MSSSSHDEGVQRLSDEEDENDSLMTNSSTVQAAPDATNLLSAAATITCNTNTTEDNVPVSTTASHPSSPAAPPASSTVDALLTSINSLNAEELAKFQAQLLVMMADKEKTARN